jgi:DNA-binding beta-propeller fold protein YncE
VSALAAMAAALLLHAAGAPAAAPLPLPGGEGGIGFDDLRWAPALGRVLVPAGRSGRLDLVAPRTRAIEEVPGFSAARGGSRGHSQGTTSADAGGGLVFASDRTRRVVAVVDARARRILSEARLAGAPDYVRWVEPLREVWVTEPGEQVIETFRLDAAAPVPALVRTGTIAVPDGPESLELDPARGRAYTNTWHDRTVAIDLATRAIAARWRNGCAGARGLAVDPARGLVLVGCDEGKAVALDPGRGGAIVGRAPAGAGVDVIAYAPALAHLYVPGADAATVTVVGVLADGALAVLGELPGARDGHCVAADDSGDVYVCDPAHGRLLVTPDPYPRSR